MNFLHSKSICVWLSPFWLSCPVSWWLLCANSAQRDYWSLIEVMNLFQGKRVVTKVLCYVYVYTLHNCLHVLIKALPRKQCHATPDCTEGSLIWWEISFYEIKCNIYIYIYVCVCVFNKDATHTHAQQGCIYSALNWSKVKVKTFIIIQRFLFQTNVYLLNLQFIKNILKLSCDTWFNEKPIKLLFNC